MTLGTMWRNTIRQCRAPMARAASTYVVSRTDNALARTTSSMRGTKDTAIAATRLNVPEPRMATIASARMMMGNEIMMSARRWMIRSVVPPK